MAKIKVRGLGVVHCDNFLARQIKDDFENGVLPGIVKINDKVSVKGRDIDSIEMEQEQVIKNDTFDAAENAYMAMRRSKLAMPPAIRARQVGMFELLWWCHTSQKTLPEDIKTKAVALQEAFFTSHPGRCFPDPVIFKEMLSANELEGDKREPGVVDSGIRVVERMVGNDMAYAKYKK